jgi:diketogulonate reductase-like aldo/keto reductase
MSDVTTDPAAVPTVALPNGERVPVLGQGTWHMAEDTRRRQDEIDALRVGIDLGLTLIDTAEMYANGRTEQLVGEAIRGVRNDVFLVTKVLPSHATIQGTVAACEGSLKRLGTDRLDLYLLHWRGTVPLDETVKAFGQLLQSGKIHAWGVSNFDVDDMRDLARTAGGSDVATDQVLYNLERRGIEFDLMPWCAQHGLPIMAYTPIGQTRFFGDPSLQRVAARHGATPAQIALAWVLRNDGVIAIPKASTVAHVQENRAAVDLHLTRDDLALLDRAFAPPRAKQQLAML